MGNISAASFMRIKTVLRAILPEAIAQQICVNDYLTAKESYLNMRRQDNSSFSTPVVKFRPSGTCSRASEPGQWAEQHAKLQQKGILGI